MLNSELFISLYSLYKAYNNSFCSLVDKKILNALTAKGIKMAFAVK